MALQDDEEDDVEAQDVVAHGVLSGLRLGLSNKIENSLPGAEKSYSFTKDVSDVLQGIELIPYKLRIRKINDNDIARYKKFYPENLRVIQEENVLIEWLCKDLELVDDFNLMHKTVLALNLLKIGRVFLKEIYTFHEGSDSIDSRTPVVQAPYSYFKKKYILDLNYKEDLQNIVKRLDSIDFEKNRSLRIACNRFLGSLGALAREDTIIDICIAFESLFDRGWYNRSYTMGEFIGMRCSKLIGKDDGEKKYIYSRLKMLFELRNEVVHGKTDEPCTHLNLINVLEYFRRSILKILFFE